MRLDPRSWLRRLWPGAAPEVQRSIWLTLDDGPDPVLTDRILRILDRHRVSATFFMIGSKVEAHEDVVRRVFAAGHRIGNHTHTHRNLSELTLPEMREEIEQAEARLAPYVVGQKLFRPPYGASNAGTDRIAAQLGYRTVLWNVDPTDWDPQSQPKAWIGSAVRQVKDNRACVVLTHENQETTADYYDLFIRRLKAIGSIRFEPPSTLPEKIEGLPDWLAGPPRREGQPRVSD